MRTIIYIAVAVLIIALFAGAALFVLNKINSGGGQASPTPAGSGLNTVQMSNNTFRPATLTVKVGATVTFQNMDSMQHTATATDGTFDTGILAPGQSQTITFTKEGSFVYHCSIHPEMTGTIVVTK